MLSSLSPDCVGAILAQLPAQSLCASRLVCKSLLVASDEDYVWTALCGRYWAIETRASCIPSAKEVFRERLELYKDLRKVRATSPSSWVKVSGGEVFAYEGSANDAYFMVHVGLVTSNRPLPPLPLGGPARRGPTVRYFEVEVVDGGLLNYIGLGFIGPSFPPGRRQPGWERGSWAYHGDNGCKYGGFGLGQPFGPTFSTHDVVGAGIVMDDSATVATVFFTKNGKLVGAPFDNVPEPTLLRPAVGLGSPREKVRLRLGIAQDECPAQASPFLFDVVAFIASWREAQLVAHCTQASGSSHPECSEGSAGT